MSRLTPDQMREVARELKKIVRDVDTFQNKYWTQIPNETHIIINARQKDILEKAHQLLTSALIITVENASDVIAKLKDVTSKIEQTLETIENIGKVVNIVTAAVAMSVSFATGNVEGISTAIGDIIEVVEDEDE